MTKLTKQEVLKTIKLIDNGDYENSLVEFFEDIDELILNKWRRNIRTTWRWLWYYFRLSWFWNKTY